MTIYCPEMGEEAPERLFGAAHNYRNTYSIDWRAEDDAEARKALRRLRIRTIGGRISFEEPGTWSTPKGAAGAVYHCLISGHGHSKLLELDLVAHRALLD